MTMFHSCFAIQCDHTKSTYTHVVTHRAVQDTVNFTNQTVFVRIDAREMKDLARDLQLRCEQEACGYNVWYRDDDDNTKSEVGQQQQQMWVPHVSDPHKLMQRFFGFLVPTVSALSYFSRQPIGLLQRCFSLVDLRQTSLEYSIRT